MSSTQAWVDDLQKYSSPIFKYRLDLGAERIGPRFKIKNASCDDPRVAQTIQERLTSSFLAEVDVAMLPPQPTGAAPTPKTAPKRRRVVVEDEEE